uniref:histone acetyltransferase n=1 Tax=Caenorhabditis tropicalis TaxID=1561998 RepID=A0A1I7UH46_9PELO
MSTYQDNQLTKEEKGKIIKEELEETVVKLEDKESEEETEYKGQPIIRLGNLSFQQDPNDPHKWIMTNEEPNSEPSVQKINQPSKPLVQHPQEKLKSSINDVPASRFESIQKCTVVLGHSSQCLDPNCRRMECPKMKRIIQHTKLCKKRINGTCPVCKQLIALCTYHAKHCTMDTCPVPFCMNIRQKLEEQKRSQQRRVDMMMRRRIEGLQSDFGGGPAPNMTSNEAPSLE